ncbi:Chondroitin sulfate synthase 1 [Trichinella spiralis]|uniref:Hexosyltransferase n=2 Tax=Trichinella spiralis TaxID=6334 RepID=A0A0V1BD16_TRISP|nr:Chondroitin sulfate synthase 1 [Trichinella spiralis]
MSSSAMQKIRRQYVSLLGRSNWHFLGKNLGYQATVLPLTVRHSGGGELDKPAILLLSLFVRVSWVNTLEEHVMPTKRICLTIFGRPVRRWLLFLIGLGLGILLMRRSAAQCGKTCTASTVLGKRRQLLFVGVMTAEKYLNTRASTIMRTWAKNLPGRVQFFVGDGAGRLPSGMPIVRLPGVDDTYPPQKKSLAMLHYIHAKYGDHFDWFLRADDDLYVKVEKLEAFLVQLNSSQPMIIGQTGFGKPFEQGKLGLDTNQPYCMGGPGVLLSREALRRTAPHVHLCLADFRSTHEDVELSRCVARFAGITCPLAYELQSLFYNNYDGSFALSGDLNVPQVHQAISLHPLKQANMMLRMHRFVLNEQLAELYGKLVRLQREEGSSSKSPSLHQVKCISADEVDVWQYISPPYMYCAGNADCPRKRIESPMQYSIRNAIQQLMQQMNSRSRELGREIQFRSVLYGYERIRPPVGVDLMLDLLLTHKRLKGKRTSIMVRRHAYLRRPFLQLQISDQSSDSESASPLPSSEITVHIVVAVHGRLNSFLRFADQIEQICANGLEKVRLIVAFFPSTMADDDRKALDRVQTLSTSVEVDLTLVEKRPFSRAVGLQVGIAKCPPDALLFLTDVDMLFTKEALYRLRANTKLGRQVFFPIVFSEFQTSAAKDGDHFDHSTHRGHFRHFGYGSVALYKSDFDAAGGLDLSIDGWGLEDVDLFQKLLNRTQLNLFRAPEPDLVHVYHPMVCDPSLAPLQYKMCKGSKADGYLSAADLTDLVYPLLENMTTRQFA